MKSENPRIILVDDQVLFVESLRNVIQSRAEDFNVVGVFFSAEAAIKDIAALQPDLVLMDIRMPGMDGVEATKRIKQVSADTKVVLLTTYYEDDYVSKAVSYGAVGYLLKDLSPDILIASMRSVLSGQLLIPSKFADRIAGLPQAHGEPQDAHDLPAWLYDLSRKERMILRLIIEGFENEEIAEKVFLAPQTVKNYISRLYAKSGAGSRSNLIRISNPFLQYL